MTGTRPHVLYRGTRSGPYVLHSRARTCAHIRNRGACSFTDLTDRMTRPGSYVLHGRACPGPYIFYR